MITILKFIIMVLGFKITALVLGLGLGLGLGARLRLVLEL